MHMSPPCISTGVAKNSTKCTFNQLYCFYFISPQLKQLGHSVDKVEFIVMGGTFMALQEEYRDYFIRNLHDALSGHTSNTVDESVK